MIEGSVQRHEEQNDGRDWLIDKNGNPIKILNEKYWIQQKFSVDPADIPDEKIDTLSKPIEEALADAGLKVA